MPRPFTVVAIIAAHNEADVIGHVVGDLIEQGVSVYVIDDNSTDGTREVAERFVNRGVLAVERFDGQPGVFEWERLLKRKAELASTLDADWFIHHDADEFRESPWPGVSLRDAILQVDRLGFNAIDFALLDFWPVADDFQPGTDVRTAHEHFVPGAAYNRLQIRCWKKTAAPIGLAESGGHEVVFNGRDVFPIPFLLRHYPIRSLSQGWRKIGPERRARLRADERARSWHVQYDGLHAETDVIRPAASLTRFDPIATRRALLFGRDGGDGPPVAGLSARVSSLTLALDDARRQLTQTQATVTEQEHEVKRLLIELRQQRDTVDGLQATVAQLTGAVERAEHRMQALLDSLSWRWTAPARAAYRILTGREA